MTPRQHQLLTFISGFTAEHGFAPSTQEMAGALKLASKSGIVRIVSALVRERFIRRRPHCSRAIELTPKGAAAAHSKSAPTTAELKRLSDIDLYDLKQRIATECDRRLDTPRSQAERDMRVGVR